MRFIRRLARGDGRIDRPEQESPANKLRCAGYISWWSRFAPLIHPPTGRGAPVATRRTATVESRDGSIEGRDSVGLYLDEIARTPLLDAATEVELSKSIEAGLMAEHLLVTGRIARAKGGAPMRATREELEWLADE